MKYTKAQRKAIYEKALEIIQSGLSPFICNSINKVTENSFSGTINFDNFPEFKLHQPDNYEDSDPFCMPQYNNGKDTSTVKFKPIREQILLNCVEMCK